MFQNIVMTRPGSKPLDEQPGADMIGNMRTDTVAQVP